MPDKVYALTEADRKAVAELVQAHNRRIGNTQNRPGPPLDDGSAPEVYIAKTPAGGIPALADLQCFDDGSLGTGTGSGTGVGTAPNDARIIHQPGSADCDIYRLVEKGEGCGAEMEIVTGVSRTVYNIFPKAAPGGAWVIVWRDKFGRWVVTIFPPSADCEAYLPTWRTVCVNGALIEYFYYVKLTAGCYAEILGPYYGVQTGCCSCGGGTAAPSGNCCDPDVPTTINLLVEVIAGSCASLDGQTGVLVDATFPVTCTWLGGISYPDPNGSGRTCTMYMRLSGSNTDCNNCILQVSTGCSPGGLTTSIAASPVSCACDPLALVFVVVVPAPPDFSCDCCQGVTLRITITE